MTVMSQAEFSRAHNVSRKTVTQWKEQGRLVFQGDSVDVEKSDAKLADAKLGRFRPVPKSAPLPESAQVKRVTSGPENEVIPPGSIENIEAFLSNLLNGQFATQAEAERVKENALAGLRGLELRTKAGSMIDIETAQTVLFEVSRSNRDAWMNWPVQVGPLIAAELDLPADRVTEILTRHVHQHLADLGEPDAQLGGEG